ncbi:hypothetical protein AXF42_Ash002218 [Apostasia shenzhenica]|uniref:Uncharacterized protein n=1 Tax=Apostasia shenzhenica TaxID=1088818 RepID=A0A2I0AN52_9ASPA|nr:hypothetical protein AXF42_Ash002218 [Apostasia shenzhenica]
MGRELEIIHNSVLCHSLVASLYANYFYICHPELLDFVSYTSPNSRLPDDLVRYCTNTIEGVEPHSCFLLGGTKGRISTARMRTVKESEERRVTSFSSVLEATSITEVEKSDKEEDEDDHLVERLKALGEQS